MRVAVAPSRETVPVPKRVQDGSTDGLLARPVVGEVDTAPFEARSSFEAPLARIAHARASTIRLWMASSDPLPFTPTR